MSEIIRLHDETDEDRPLTPEELREEADERLIKAVRKATEEVQACTGAVDRMGLLPGLVRTLRRAGRTHVDAMELSVLCEDPDLAADVLAHGMAGELPEFASRDQGGTGIADVADRIRVVFRLSAWKTLGVPVWGKAKPIPARARALDPDGPVFEVELSLPIWLLLDERERERLVHHELMHLLWDGRPRARAHDFEEFAGTVARYGLASPDQAPTIVAAMGEQVQEQLREWGFDGAGQGLLFGGPALAQAIGAAIADTSALRADVVEAIGEALALPDECADAGVWVDALQEVLERIDGAVMLPGDVGRVGGIQAAIAGWSR